MMPCLQMSKVKSMVAAKDPQRNGRIVVVSSIVFFWFSCVRWSVAPLFWLLVFSAKEESDFSVKFSFITWLTIPFNDSKFRIYANYSF